MILHPSFTIRSDDCSRRRREQKEEQKEEPKEEQKEGQKEEPKEEQKEEPKEEQKEEQKEDWRRTGIHDVPLNQTHAYAATRDHVCDSGSDSAVGRVWRRRQTRLRHTPRHDDDRPRRAAPARC